MRVLAAGYYRGAYLCTVSPGSNLCRASHVYVCSVEGRRSPTGPTLAPACYRLIVTTERQLEDRVTTYIQIRNFFCNTYVYLLKII